MMTKQNSLIVLTLTLSLSGTVAAGQQPQTPVSPTAPVIQPAQETKPTPRPAPPPPAPRPMAADQKAYADAARIKDPVKKIEALEKFITDHPASFMGIQAHLDILDALIKSQPTAKDKIMVQVERTMQRQGGFSTGFAEASIATHLLKAGLLAEAEQFAQKSVTASEENLARMVKTLQQQKARPLAVLGQVYLKQEKLKEAEQKLKEAYAIHPQETGVAVALADIAAKQGRDQEVIDYLMAATRLKPEERQQLEAAWRKTHKGELAGLEEALDARYHKEYSNLVPVTRYQPTARRSDRTVLAEVFTGASCGPCVAADLAFEAMMERYASRELIVVMYHLHIPGPDPMTNAATVARGKYYNVNSVPSYTVDGAGLQSGGGPKEMTKNSYARVNPLIEQRLDAPAEISLKFDAARAGNTVKVTANVEFDRPVSFATLTPATLAGATSKDVAQEIKNYVPTFKLHILLVEEKLRYAGENGIRIHPMVVRATAGPDANGFALEVGKPEAQTISASFDVAAISAELKKYLDDFEIERSKDRDDKFAFSEKKHEINPSNLAVIAFVQEEQSKKVLQSALVRLSGKGVVMK